MVKKVSLQAFDVLPDLSEIRAKRRSSGLTQAELAKLAGVSQSLIAKLESGRITPSYDKAKRLFDALEKLHHSTGANAGRLMVKRIYSVRSNDSAKKAIKIMQGKSISQLPVVDAGKCIGLVSEKDIVGKIGAAGKIEINSLRVSKLMGEAPPTIQENTPAEIVSHLLAYSPAVLVASKGKIKGIITKADMLKAVLRKR